MVLTAFGAFLLVFFLIFVLGSGSITNKKFKK